MTIEANIQNGNGSETITVSTGKKETIQIHNDVMVTFTDNTVKSLLNRKPHATIYIKKTIDDKERRYRTATFTLYSNGDIDMQRNGCMEWSPKDNGLLEEEFINGLDGDSLNYFCLKELDIPNSIKSINIIFPEDHDNGNY